MAVLQYVGARYVPVFYKNPDGSWDWEAGVSYEPLTIVKYGENSYTSRMLVPATVGSPNLNPDYWANTGTFNGAVRELQERIDEVESSMSMEIHKISSLKNRSFLFLGDSYGSLSGDVTGWGTRISALLNVYGIKNRVIARGGYGWRGYNGTWSDLLAEAGDISQYTDIIILGGANDVEATRQEVSSSMDTFMGSLYGAPLSVRYGFVGHYTQGISVDNNAKQKAMQESLCFDKSIAYIGEAFGWIYSNSMIGADGLHPTNDGCNAIARSLCQYMLSGDIRFEGKDVNVRWNKNRYGKYLQGVMTVPISGIEVSDGTIIPLFSDISSMPTYLFPQGEQSFSVRCSSSGKWFHGYMYIEKTGKMSLEVHGISAPFTPSSVNVLWNDFFPDGTM